MMNKYGVSDVCPECGNHGMATQMIKLGDGTRQEESRCPKCGFETARIVTEESADDSPPASASG